tara:strand:- start:732 stop:1232 length:501 start_codon:yes stop_codon:yes gene_type:complete
MLINFCSLLNSHYKNSNKIGNRLIVDYYAYQHLRWIDKTDTVFGNTVMLGWIIGNKAFSSWINKNEGSMYIARERVLGRFKIVYKDIFEEYTQVEYNKVEVHEENIKHQFIKTNDIFAHCLQNTTLYNKRSSYCLTCKFRTECKKIQKEVYPKIYKSRNAVTDPVM